MTNPTPRATPPRGTTRAVDTGPADQISCPGCGVMHTRRLICCGNCWRRVPGELKGSLSDTEAATFARARAVAAIRNWLTANAP